MNRKLALALVVLLWAGIYLPGLGRLELKGEEPRRTLPAMAMLDSGDWIVPHLNGHPYLSKPPLVNWAIAGCMVLTGRRDEFAARLPSALSMLALALVVVWTGCRWLAVEEALTAAIFLLVSVALVEKGRLAEIEALYIALTGIAFAFWLASWMNRETGWRLWVLPGVFLGLGLLTKGPTHLLLFYAVVLPVLISAGEARELRSLAHLGSLALAAGIAAAWFIPYRHAIVGIPIQDVWMRQMANRVGGGSTLLGDWLPNLPLAIQGGLPWIIFAWLWWDPRTTITLASRSDRLGILIRSARLPLVLAFAGPMLIPGMLARYTMPLLPAIALLLAPAATSAPERWRAVWLWANRGLAALILVATIAVPYASHALGKEPVMWNPIAAAALLFPLLLRYRELDPHRLACGSAAVADCGVFVYAFDVMPQLFAREKLRSVGWQVAAVVPKTTPVFLVDHEYEPLLFYVNRPYRLAAGLGAFPAEAEYLLLRDTEMARAHEFLGNGFRTIPMWVRGKNPFFLLKIPVGKPKSANSSQPTLNKG